MSVAFIEEKLFFSFQFLKVWMEVLLGGEADMLLCNTDSGYNYAAYLVNALTAAG
jgi:hypothetical protein